MLKLWHSYLVITNSPVLLRALSVTTCLLDHILLVLMGEIFLLVKSKTNIFNSLLAHLYLNHSQGQVLPGVSDGLNGIEQSLSSHNKVVTI